MFVVACHEAAGSNPAKTLFEEACCHHELLVTSGV